MVDTERMANARRIYLETGSLPETARRLNLTSRQRAHQLVLAAGRNVPLAVRVNLTGAPGATAEDMAAVGAAVRRALEAAGVTLTRGD